MGVQIKADVLICLCSMEGKKYRIIHIYKEKEKNADKSIF